MANPMICMMLRPLKQRENAKKLIINTQNGIYEKRFIKIGGIEQWITIRGRDKNNPAILILHGGPGSTYTPFNSWLLEWEEYFTVIQWDQIGSGKTFKKNGPVEDISFERLAQDGIGLVKIICEYLHHKKIILLGSSAGSLIGIRMIKQQPDLFYAYIGANQNSPDTGVFYKALKEYSQRNDKKALQFLEKIGSTKNTWTKDDVDKINRIAIKIDKKAPNMIFDLMLPAMLYDNESTMQDIKIMNKGMDYALEKLYGEMINFDFDDVGYQFKIPFFIFQGEYDILTPIEDARQYFDKIQAPHKEFVIIKNAGHLAEFANTKDFLTELKYKVLPIIK
jgi:pimeloyl-ACP methyl ester carboxylesterase